MTGTGGTGKSTLVNFIYEELVTELFDDEWKHTPRPWDLEVAVLPSATRTVRDLCGVGLTDYGGDSTQLWSAVQRRFWEFEHQDKQVVISERCGIDEVLYQERRILQLKSNMNGLQLPPTSEAAYRQKAELHNAGATRQVLGQQAVEEVADYWDVIYWLQPGPDFESYFVEDGDRASAKYAREIHALFQQFMPSMEAAVPGKIVKMPHDLDEAKQYLREEVPKWQGMMTRSMTPMTTSTEQLETDLET